MGVRLGPGVRDAKAGPGGSFFRSPRSASLWRSSPGWRFEPELGRDRSGRSGRSGTVVNQVTRLRSSVLTRVGESRQAPAIHTVGHGPGLTIDGKPGIVFVSEESCPFCAAERWPVVIALSHFGTWHHLGSTTSSSTDIYPSTATFSFSGRHVHQPVSFRPDHRTGEQCWPTASTRTPLDTTLISRYDVPPYVNTADQSGSVPFLDIDNHYILAGAQYDPQVLAGLSMSRIASQLDDPTSPVAMAIDESANALIAAIDQVLHPPAVVTRSRDQ